MRVTEKSIYGNMTDHIVRGKSRLAQLNDQAATGQKVLKPSDDPVSIAAIMNFDVTIQGAEQYQKNIDHGRLAVQAADGALAETNNILIRIKELSVQFANDTYNAEARNSASTEVDAALDALVGLGNTQVGETYIFGGHQTTTAPFTSTTYSGDSGVHQVEVGKNVTVEINIDAGVAFKGNGGGEDLFDLLSDLSTALQANDTATIQQIVGRVDTAVQQVAIAQSETGAKQNRLDVAQSVLAQVAIGAQQAKANFSDADIAKAVSDLALHQQTLEAAMAVAGRTSQLSLLNFL